MDETQKEKINRFLSDEVMAGAVKKVLVDAFLKDRGDKDVQTLAASRIAIDLLEDGWKTLNKVKNKEEKEDKLSSNPGL